MEITVNPSPRVAGTITLPGDKSISHRALMIAALSEGDSEIRNLNNGQDVQSTIRCLQKLGVKIRQQDSKVIVPGAGLDSLTAPEGDLDAGNSGTTMRLLSGILAGQPFGSTITGDASLRRRPMARIVRPLRSMGAQVEASNESYPPLSFSAAHLHGMTYRMPVASAQVKSCLLFAGLFADGKTEIEEQQVTRDHTERLLSRFGAQIERENGKTSVRGCPRMGAQVVQIPGDFSSAAFFIAAALVAHEGEVFIKNVGINPTRSALLHILAEMGADIDIMNVSEVDNELSADLFVRNAELRGVSVRGAMVSQIIDEIAILAVIATQADGVMHIRDAAELRVKESDRIASVVKNLRQMGAQVEEYEDGLTVTGPTKLHGTTLDSFRDHRIAMAFAVAGLVAEGETVIGDAECVNISCPDFFDQLGTLTGG